MTRRELLTSMAVTALALLGAGCGAGSTREEGDEAMGEDFEPLDVKRDLWRPLVSDDAYRVLFREATERPFASPLNDEKRDGTFVCAACYLPLFPSRYKYDSGTGWPSFFDAIPGHVGTKRDFKLVLPRTEYHCARCGGHQGHRFGDGPEPTGLRYCNNGVALRFVPADGELPALRAPA